MSLQNDVQNACSIALIGEFSKLKPFLNNQEWLYKFNHLKYEAIKKLDEGKGYCDVDLKQYIAASTLIHLNDSWEYFCQAINAIVNGNTILAQHLIYYSELRSTMSLLATQGIGIFNKRHFYINSFGHINPISIKLGTHEIIWQLFKIWGESDKSRLFLEKVIKPQNKQLKDWINNHTSKQWNSLTSEIFKQWGVDLEEFSKDRSIRNTVSYRPTKIHYNKSLDNKENLETILSIWELFEPEGNGKLNNFDLLLLVQSMKMLDKYSNTNYKKNIKRQLRMLKKLNFPNNTLKGYLKIFKELENNKILKYASKKYNSISESLNSGTNHLEMLSRASILLRISTGACQLLLKESNVGVKDIDFWLNGIVKDNYFYDDVNNIEYDDLWLDIKDDSITEIRNEMEDIDNFRGFKEKNSYALALLSEFERVLLWGIIS